MPQQYVREGYLVKQGGIIRSWRKRWFRLSRGQMAYYKNDVEADALGVVKLIDASVEKLAPGAKKHTHSPHCMALTTAHRVYYLCAETAEDLAEWIASIEYVISHVPGAHKPDEAHEEATPPPTDQKTIALGNGYQLAVPKEFSKPSKGEVSILAAELALALDVHVDSSCLNEHSDCSEGHVAWMQAWCHNLLAKRMSTEDAAEASPDLFFSEQYVRPEACTVRGDASTYDCWIAAFRSFVSHVAVMVVRRRHLPPNGIGFVDFEFTLTLRDPSKGTSVVDVLQSFARQLAPTGSSQDYDISAIEQRLGTLQDDLDYFRWAQANFGIFGVEPAVAKGIRTSVENAMNPRAAVLDTDNTKTFQDIVTQVVHDKKVESVPEPRVARYLSFCLDGGFDPEYTLANVVEHRRSVSSYEAEKVDAVIDYLLHMHVAGAGSEYVPLSDIVETPALLEDATANDSFFARLIELGYLEDRFGEDHLKLLAAVMRVTPSYRVELAAADYLARRAGDHSDRLIAQGYVPFLMQWFQSGSEPKQPASAVYDGSSWSAVHMPASTGRRRSISWSGSGGETSVAGLTSSESVRTALPDSTDGDYEGYLTYSKDGKSAKKRWAVLRGDTIRIYKSAKDVNKSMQDKISLFHCTRVTHSENEPRKFQLRDLYMTHEFQSDDEDEILTWLHKVHDSKFYTGKRLEGFGGGAPAAVAGGRERSHTASSRPDQGSARDDRPESHRIRTEFHDELIRADIGSAIATLTSKATRAKETVGCHKVFPRIVRLMAGTNQDLIASSVTIARYVASMPEMRSAVGKHGGIPRLVAVLHRARRFCVDTSPVLADALAALWSLAESEALRTQMVKDENPVPAIADVLRKHQDDQAVVEKGLGAIKVLVANNADAAKMLGSLDVVPVLAAVSDKHARASKSVAMSLLGIFIVMVAAPGPRKALEEHGGMADRVTAIAQAHQADKAVGVLAKRIKL